MKRTSSERVIGAEKSINQGLMQSPPCWPSSPILVEGRSPINFKRLYYVVCCTGCTQEQGKVNGRVNVLAPVRIDILKNGLAISQVNGARAPLVSEDFLGDFIQVLVKWF